MLARGGHSKGTAWIIVASLLAFMLLLTGCGGSSHSGSEELAELGEGEGKVDLITWAGYVQPAWFSAFERRTGCKVKDKTAETAAEMVQLMRSGQYDGASAPGNVSGRLIRSGDISPVNVSLVPNYRTVFGDLKKEVYDTFGGVHYGIPQSRGVNLLMWSSEDVKPAPTSWELVLNPRKAIKYKDEINGFDDPIYIADAAVYLKAHRPELEIDDPYELNDQQFDAAVNLLKEQRPFVREYWSDPHTHIEAFFRDKVQIGTTPQYQYFELAAVESPVAVSPASQGFLPEEGATGWSNAWIVGSNAEHPNCMYMWMDWMASPKVSAELAEAVGEAPAQSLACDLTADRKFCLKYHADEPGFWKRVYYWQTPVADCGNGTADCKGYKDWVRAWASIKG